jgi:hypothetical protein
MSICPACASGSWSSRFRHSRSIRQRSSHWLTQAGRTSVRGSWSMSHGDRTPAATGMAPYFAP